MNTNSISHIRRGLVERKLVVQDKQIGFMDMNLGKLQEMVRDR